MLLTRLFERIITIGRLRITDASGRCHDIAGAPGPSAAIRLHDPALHWKLVVRPRLSLPEAFMDGSLTIEVTKTAKPYVPPPQPKVVAKP